MANKTAWVASSLSLCTASLVAGGEDETAWGAGAEGYQPLAPDWEKKQVAKEVLYQYLNPISSVTEGKLAVHKKKPIRYEVKPGDTLYAIGLRYGVDSEKLLEYNRIENPRRLQPGQKGKIPVELERIRVKEEQTLTEVAEDNEVSVTALKEANPDLSLADAPYVGQVLVSPREFDPPEEKPSSTKGQVKLAADSSTEAETGFRWPVTGQITSKYGSRHSDMHTGIDIWNQAEENAVIQTARPGKGVRAGWAGGYGNLVVVEPQGGWSTYYAHMSRITVSTGQSVTGDDALGYLRSTGNSTGVHLRFEVRRNDRPIDPLTVLP